MLNIIHISIVVYLQGVLLQHGFTQHAIPNCSKLVADRVSEIRVSGFGIAVETGEMDLRQVEQGIS